MHIYIYIYTYYVYIYIYIYIYIYTHNNSSGALDAHVPVRPRSPAGPPPQYHLIV